GRHDVGQAAVITQGRVEAIEGAEGTDRMIARVGQRRREAAGDPIIRSRGVLVKRPKPGQDLRVDLPAIGPDTVQKAADARLTGIAAMSGHVLAASRFELIHAAERDGIFVVGLADQAKASGTHAATKLADGDPLVFGKIDPASAVKADVQRGIAIMSMLAQFSIGTALVIRKGRVLAIGTSESSVDVLERAAHYYKPGRKRVGIAFLGHRTPVDEALIEAIAAQGLEGLVVMFGREDRPQHRGSIVARADALGLFIAGAPVAAMEPA
ncbi:MAG TPA: UDP-2,3-diacylglucosamine diphosphatase LpxI, partial [Hyphomicrobium sp.]|nr:UDP-2,3-diacylglucosamine diphosphatase LpxI [Hyphomicrobium sp.]